MSFNECPIYYAKRANDSVRQVMKTITILCECTGWSGPWVPLYGIKHIITMVMWPDAPYHTKWMFPDRIRTDVCTECDPEIWEPLQKHAYSNILKILPPNNENFQIKNSDIFHITAQNIDCGYSLEQPLCFCSKHRGSSNEYPQFMFFSRNKKNNVYPSKPQFYYIKVGFKGIKII